MRSRSFLIRIGLMVALLVILPAGGCTVTIEPDGNGGGGGNGDGTPTVITVHLINNTATTLDPEIYLAPEWISVEDLFNADRKYTAFGVGTLGLLAEHGEDTFELPCNQVGMLATKGGRFGDNLNAPDGTGREVILWQNASFYCGDSITITYSGSGHTFDTQYTVRR